MDIDLNIENYDLNDILNLFKIPYHFDEQDLRNVKKTVLNTHPDKSKLESKYFLFFSKAYKLLFQIYTFRHKIITANDNFDKDYDPEYDIEKESEAIIDKIKSSKNFNKLFNKIFEENAMTKLDNGYGEWLKEEIEDDSVKCKTRSEINKAIEKKKSTMQSALINYEYNEMCYTNGQTNLDEETVYSSDIFGKLKYDDLKEAHENSVIPVLEKNYRKKYNTLDELKKERQQNTNPFNQEQSNNILRDNKITEERNATNRAFKMAKQTEIADAKNKLLLRKFKQIMN